MSTNRDPVLQLFNILDITQVINIHTSTLIFLLIIEGIKLANSNNPLYTNALHHFYKAFKNNSHILENLTYTIP